MAAPHLPAAGLLLPAAGLLFAFLLCLWRGYFPPGRATFLVLLRNSRADSPNNPYGQEDEIPSSRERAVLYF